MNARDSGREETEMIGRLEFEWLHLFPLWCI